MSISIIINIYYIYCIGTICQNNSVCSPGQVGSMRWELSLQLTAADYSQHSTMTQIYYHTDHAVHVWRCVIDIINVVYNFICLIGTCIHRNTLLVQDIHNIPLLSFTRYILVHDCKLHSPHPLHGKAFLNILTILHKPVSEYGEILNPSSLHLLEAQLVTTKPIQKQKSIICS